MNNYIILDEYRKRNCINFINSITDYGKYEVTIKPYKKDRSKAQNRLYHMWLKIIADELGNTHDELHDILKVKFLGVDKKIVDMQPLIIPKSTTKLNTKEMTDYLNKVEMLAGELNISLPHPEITYNDAMGIR